MATTPKTVRTYALDGTKKDFTIPFEYLARKFVVVTLIGATRRELILNTEYRFTTNTTITTTKAWGPADNFDLIEIRRLTSATERLVDFADGSILRAYDLNISQVQSLHIAEEARDLTADTIGVNNDGDLDARARRIVNLADGVNDGDAVNLRQQKQWAGSALNQAQASAASAAASEASRQASLAQANASAASAAASLTYSQNSQQSAVNSFNSESNSLNYAQASQAARDQSQAWASKAEDQVVGSGLYSSYHYSRKSAASATASAGSAAAAASSSSFSTTEANRATTEANRAKTEADKLGSFNGLAGAIDSVSGSIVFWKGVQVAPGEFQVRLTAKDNEANFTFCAANGTDPIRLVRTADRAIHLYDNAQGDRVIFGETYARINRNLTLGNGATLTVDGNLYASSTFIGAGAAQCRSILQVSAPAADNSAHAHLWFRDSDQSAERAVIYADTLKQLNIRANSGSGGTCVVRSNNNWVFPNSIEADRAAGHQTIFKSPYGITANAYAESCLQLFGSGTGGMATLGFRNNSRAAGALWLTNGSELQFMRNNGVNVEMINNGNLNSHLANFGAGVLGSYGLCYSNLGSHTTPGNSMSGGNLIWSDVNKNNGGTVGSGTWRAMGYGTSTGASLYLRVA